nr:MAG TPA: hypothetical protein [Caudoviricetes sp.]
MENKNQLTFEDVVKLSNETNLQLNVVSIIVNVIL